MVLKKKYLVGLLSALLLCGTSSAQNDDYEETPAPHKSKFHFGFFVGSYFANKHSASIYNGYGFNLDKQQNDFAQSWIYQKIVNEYGGGYGQTDQVALALSVDPKQWVFQESDMPINMHYNPAIHLGFNFRVPVKKTAFFLLNINGARLGVDGNFTITTLKPQSSTNPALNSNIKTCVIKGQEQRLQFELGFQKVFGDDGDDFSFFGELGFVGTLTKFTRNYIIINTLQVDITSYVYNPAYPVPVPGRVPVGFGVGAYAGGGVNMNVNPRVTVQLLYNLLQEKINIGANPALKLQHSAGLRFYYNF